MVYELQRRINSDINLKRYLRENSKWYKSLNRDPNNFYKFADEMRHEYHLTFQDKFNRTVDNISMLSSFLDVLKN